MRAGSVTLFLLLFACGAQSQPRGQPMAKDMVLRSPNDFPMLPESIGRDLNRRGCRIPQGRSGGTDAPGNVITGRFRSPTQMDWAVLCSKGGVSSLLVYWRGDVSDVLVEAGSPDLQWMEWAGPAEGWHYTRYLAAASPEKIRDFAEAFGDPDALPDPLDHDGIEEGATTKASVVRYWHEGRWMELTGMD